MQTIHTKGVIEVNSAMVFALLASVGNALFVYGQRGATRSENPFLFTLFSVLVCGTLFVIASFLFKTPDDIHYVLTNYRNILISGLGFFITFVGFFLLYSRYGASYYVIYAVLSIITTSIIVGMLLYHEPFNKYHLMAIGTALLTISLFWIGQTKL